MDMAIITLLSIIAPLLFAIAAGIVSIGLKSRKINLNNAYYPQNAYTLECTCLPILNIGVNITPHINPPI